MPSPNSTFKMVDHFGNTYLMDRLEINLKTWFDWAFLKCGAWSNVAIPTNTGYSGDISTLRLVEDASYTSGTVWEAARKDWVWETGVNYVDVDGATQNPTSPAVIKVNNVITAPSFINYPLGKVVFSSAIASTATVQAQYSYRSVQVYRANDTNWWKELQYRSFRVDDSHFTQLSNGVWSVGSHHRVQMPCLVIEAVPRCISRGFELGDGAAWVEQDVLVHVLAEDSSMRNRLVDMMRSQFDSTIYLFNNDTMVSSGDYPLDYRGEIVDSSQTYPALVASGAHRWKQCRFARTSVSEVESINSRLYEGVVRMTCELILDA